MFIRKYALLVVILIVAVLLRMNTFWLPHISDDEYYITALALKLDVDGLAGYNLWGIDFEEFTLDGKHTIHEISRSITDEEGGLLRTMHPELKEVYSRSLYHTPPAMPWLIKLSQRWVGGSNGYFLSSSNIGQKHLTNRPADIFQAQLYVTLIPFIFSLLMIFLVYMLARRLFNTPTALIATALMAINPVSMLAAQRIWSDEASLVFILLSCLLLAKYLSTAYGNTFTGIGRQDGLWKNAGASAEKKTIATESGNREPLRGDSSTAPGKAADSGEMGSCRSCIFFGFLAGMAAGAAYPFKATAGIWLVVVLLFYFWQQRSNFRSRRGIKLLLASPVMWLFALGFLVTTAWWFYVAWQAHGTPFYFPVIADDISHGFYGLPAGRPHPLLLFSTGLLWLSPLFLAGIATLWRSVRHRLSPGRQWVFPLLFIWIVTWFLMMGLAFGSQEHRHMLPAYPALAMLAAWAINLLREWTLPYTRNWRWLGTNELLFILFIVAARYTSITMAEVINSGAALIIKP